jgi:hypothetical protein
MEEGNEEKIKYEEEEKKNEKKREKRERKCIKEEEKRVGRRVRIRIGRCEI